VKGSEKLRANSSSNFFVSSFSDVLLLLPLSRTLCERIAMREMKKVVERASAKKVQSLSIKKLMLHC
jgi:UPF0716 family protein affecting phage T7 exclusion